MDDNIAGGIAHDLFVDILNKLEPLPKSVDKLALMCLISRLLAVARVVLGKENFNGCLKRILDEVETIVKDEPLKGNKPHN